MKNWEQFLNAASGDIRRLDYVDRFSTVPVTVKENVSQHSYWVAMYSLMLHKELSGDQGLIAPILVKALIHDLAEAKTSDHVRTWKYSSKELKAAIDKSEEAMIQEFPYEVRQLYVLQDQLVKPKDKNYVKAVVKAADFMSLFSYLNREFNRGNTEINSFLTRMELDLSCTATDLETDNDERIQSLSGLYHLMSGWSRNPRSNTCNGNNPFLSFSLGGEQK